MGNEFVYLMQLQNCGKEDGFKYAQYIEIMHVATDVLQNYCILMILLEQMQEWIAMIVIISIQKGRRIEELTFNHYAERITEKIDKNDKLTFRRKEKRMKRAFQLINFVFVPILFVIFAIDIFRFDYENKKNRNIINWIKYITLTCFIVLFILSFSCVYHLLNKLHRLEFEKNKRQITWFFAVVLVIAINVIYIEINSSLY